MSKISFTKIILIAILAGILFWLYQNNSSSQSKKLNSPIVSKTFQDTAQKSEEETIRKVIESETAAYERIAAHQRQEMERAKMRPFNKPPKPIGGIAALQKNLVYPEEARHQGIEGMVIIEILINEYGKVKETRVVKSISTDCDLAAVSAIQKTRWEPAEKEGKPIKAWTAVPVNFRIKP